MLTRTPLSVGNSIDMLIRQSRSNVKEIVTYQPKILSEVGGEAVLWTFTRKSSHFERI